MKYPKTQQSGSGDNLNQKQAQQQNGPEDVMGGKTAEERNKDVAEAEAEDFLRMDKLRQRMGKPDAKEFPSED